MIKQEQLIKDLEAPLPPLLSGHIYTFYSGHTRLLKELIAHYSAQTTSCYLCDSSVPVDERLLSATTCAKAMEVKQRHRYQGNQFLAALSSLSQRTNFIVIHLTAEQTAFHQFLLYDPQLIALENWAAEHGKVICLAVSGIDTTKDTQEWITTNENHFQSLTRLDKTPSGLMLTVHYWFYRGKVINRSLPLEIGADGAWALDKNKQVDSSTTELKHENAPVYFISSAVTGREITPAGWRSLSHESEAHTLVDPNSDDIILLAFYRGQDVSALMRTVFELRQHFGNYIRIFIRELDQSVRHTDEQLLLQSGATLILPLNLRFSQVISLIRSSSGWRFPHKLAADFAQIEQRYIPSDLEGYRTCEDFIRDAYKLVELTQKKQVEFSYTIAKPAPGLKLVDILMRFKHRREGDLITNCGDEIHIFLFGCREQDVQPTLEYLFGAPVANLFDSDVHINTAKLALRKLENLAEQPPSRDYSVELELAKQTLSTDEKEQYRRMFPTDFAPLSSIDSKQEP